MPANNFCCVVGAAVVTSQHVVLTLPLRATVTETQSHVDNSGGLAVL